MVQDGEQRRPAKRPRLEAASAAAAGAAGEATAAEAEDTVGVVASSPPLGGGGGAASSAAAADDVLASPGGFHAAVETPKPTAAAYAGMSPAAALLAASCAADADADALGTTKSGCCPKDEELGFVLYVRWFGTAGQTKLNRLPLRELRAAQLEDDLGGLPMELVDGQYPERARLPRFCTDAAGYARFTPRVECLALPGDVVRTEVRLVLSFRGWEYTVVRQALQPTGAPQQQQQQQGRRPQVQAQQQVRAPDNNNDDDSNNHQQGQQQQPQQQQQEQQQQQQQQLLPALEVMVAEFQGSDPLMAALGLRVSMVAYPMVALRRPFLEATAAALRADPGAFRGLL